MVVVTRRRQACKLLVLTEACFSGGGIKFLDRRRDRASPKKSSLKIALNRKTLHRKSQKLSIPHPRLVSPIKLRLALS